MPAQADNGFQNGGDTDDGNTDQRTERGGTSGAVATDDGEPKLLEMGGAGTGNGADGGSGSSDESGVLVDEKMNANLLPDRINNCVPDLLVSAGDLAGSGGDLGAVGVVESEPIIFTGEKSILFTGEKSADERNQQDVGDDISTGEKKKGRGRPKKQDSEKPFHPQYYEWRSDSGGWKYIRRFPQTDGKLGYEYVGFLNPQRWEFFKRFDDEQFIKAVTRLFERRKQARSVRSGRLRLAGGQDYRRSGKAGN